MKSIIEPEFSANGSAKDLREDTVVAGFGSPHGDDQAGWQVLVLLGRRPHPRTRFVKITEGTQLIGELDGCRRLIIVDACRGGAQIGATTHLKWPDPRIRQYHNHSTHGVGLCNTLHLAERLSRLPPSVEVFGIEIGNCWPLGEMSPAVVRAVVELEAVIGAEICDAAYA